MQRSILALLILSLAACGDKDDSAVDVIDVDQDGHEADVDCDDDDPAIHPGATEEPYNGVDDDCDEATPDDDLDVDGYGIDDDCDDEDAAINPDAEELCDEVDNDCDGEIDVGATDASTWYFDNDADGFGDIEQPLEACEQPQFYVDNGDDCNESNTSIHPDADEECDGDDNDCDGEIDEDDAVDAGDWYADVDGDGFGDEKTLITACEQPKGYLELGGDPDCDDGDAGVNPDADELCNEIDDDCDGSIDEDGAIDAPAWYADADGDGYGDATATVLACDQPSGYIDDDTDCDDGNASIHPGADEYCDTQDWDCDGDTDDDHAVDASTWYLDADGDGFGDSSSTTAACTQPTGYVGDDTDCDDTDALVFPSAPELCNEVDDDCDGTADEDSPVDAPTWYADLDGDGYGNSLFSAVACEQPTGFVSDNTDCDDTDANVSPDDPEVAGNSVDDDCDGNVDEPPQPEICDNGDDDDADGMMDCEDSDCVSECLEDCTNGLDDDADGDVDCEDDECYGLVGCGGPYTVSLSTEIDAVGWAFGPYLPKLYDGDAAVALMYASVVLTATADGWSGTSFSCSGESDGYSWIDDGLYYGGTDSGVGYVFPWEPSAANGGLVWSGSCPVDSLPMAYLGLTPYVHDTVYRRDDDGSWYAQYLFSRSYTSDFMPYWYLAWLYTGVQQDTVSWTGTYEYP